MVVVEMVTVEANVRFEEEVEELCHGDDLSENFIFTGSDNLRTLVGLACNVTSLDPILSTPIHSATGELNMRNTSTKCQVQNQKRQSGSQHQYT